MSHQQYLALKCAMDQQLAGFSCRRVRFYAEKKRSNYLQESLIHEEHPTSAETAP